MKKGKLLRFATCLGLLLLPISAGAMDMNHAGHGTAQAATPSEHAGMNMDSPMVKLGKVSVNGVTAVADISDVRAAMHQAGMTTTHHMMVAFTDAKGKPLTQGTVAVKVSGPNGAAGAPIRLMQMGDGFGSDLTLAQPGKYQLEVGTQFQDGVARKFGFKHTVQ